MKPHGRSGTSSGPFKRPGNFSAWCPPPRISRARAKEIQHLSTAQFEVLWSELETEELRLAALVARCETDRELWCLTFFGELLEVGWSPLHRDLLARNQPHWRERTEREKVATAAPRGNAKTTVKSFFRVLHAVVYGLERFIVLGSTDFGLSKDLVADLHQVLSDPEGYPLLHAAYGPIRVRGGDTGFVVTCPRTDAVGVRVLATSANSTLRGRKHAGIRPTWVILDDLEHPKHVLSAEHRAYVWSWINGDVLKCGRAGTVYDLVGTVLHPDSALARATRDPGWSSRVWSAIVRRPDGSYAWPVRSDLWEQCRMRWADLGDPARLVTARAFYEAHREEMDRGAEVLWPELEPLYELMVMRWSDGEGAFYRDKLNDPRDPERMVFDVERFVRCTFDGVTITTGERRGADGQVVIPSRKIAISDCDLAHWLDPSLGKSSSDYPALATVARDRRFGFRFVLHCSMDKGPPSRQRARVWALFEQYSRGRFGTDASGLGAMFDEGFERERQERQKAGQPWNLAIQGYPTTQNADLDVARLQPHAENGWIQFAADLPPVVIEQFRDHPTAAHNDGPVAIERADWLLTSSPTITPTATW